MLEQEDPAPRRVRQRAQVRQQARRVGRRAEAHRLDHGGEAARRGGRQRGEGRLREEARGGVGGVVAVELGAGDGQHGGALVDEGEAGAAGFAVPLAVAAGAGAHFEDVAVRLLGELLAQGAQLGDAFGPGDVVVVRGGCGVVAGGDVGVLREGGFRAGEAAVEVEGVG